MVMFMYDIFSFSRGRLFLEDTDLYAKFFSEARSKTAEHSIYDRSVKALGDENKNPRKLTKTEEN